ncbi:MAG: DUF1080 domain-containing protein, partial [Thermoguttaceae bacterium]|nr:DUF1080 domain-containing protein [Thermoguttaceae bacterium]
MKKTLVSVVAATLVCAFVAVAFAQDAPQRQRRGNFGPGAGMMGMGPMGARNAVPLFGEKLENADFPEGVWSINDEGELVATKDAVIWTKEKYSSFYCSFEFNLSEHTNGGFLIQCSNKENWIPNTIEIQLLDDFGKDPDYHSCGSIYGFQAPSKNTTKKPGEWNKMDVMCMGRMITVVLNGEVINRINTAEWTDNAKSPAGTDIEEKFHGHSLAS